MEALPFTDSRRFFLSVSSFFFRLTLFLSSLFPQTVTMSCLGGVVSFAIEIFRFHIPAFLICYKIRFIYATAAENFRVKFMHIQAIEYNFFKNMVIVIVMFNILPCATGHHYYTYLCLVLNCPVSIIHPRIFIHAETQNKFNWGGRGGVVKSWSRPIQLTAKIYKKIMAAN